MKGTGQLAGSLVAPAPTQACQSLELGTKVLKERGIVSLCPPTPFTIEGSETLAIGWRDGGFGARCLSWVDSNRNGVIHSFIKHPLCARPCIGWQDTVATHTYVMVNGAWYSDILEFQRICNLGV